MQALWRRKIVSSRKTKSFGEDLLCSFYQLPDAPPPPEDPPPPEKLEPPELHDLPEPPEENVKPPIDALPLVRILFLAFLYQPVFLIVNLAIGKAIT